MSNEHLVEWELAGETEVLGEKICLSATLSTIYATWPDVESNLSRLGGKSTDNRLKYGTDTAVNSILKSNIFWGVTPYIP
jgi:hypothetical protein